MRQTGSNAFPVRFVTGRPKAKGISGCPKRYAARMTVDRRLYALSPTLEPDRMYDATVQYDRPVRCATVLYVNPLAFIVPRKESMRVSRVF